MYKRGHIKFLIVALAIIVIGFGFLTSFDYSEPFNTFKLGINELFSNSESFLTGATISLQEEVEVVEETNLQTKINFLDGIELQGGDPGNATQCGTIVGNVTLLQDVDSSGTCFVINAPGVTLDCAGHTISYGSEDNAQGVNVNNMGSTVVKNCNFVLDNQANFNNKGLTFLNVLEGEIINNTFNGKGMQLSGCTAPTVANNTFQLPMAAPQEKGMDLQNNRDMLVDGNLVNMAGDSPIGIASYSVGEGSSTNNTLTYNVVIINGTSEFSATSGIRLEGTANSTLSNNNVTGLGRASMGINLINCDTTTFTSNRITTQGNQGTGFNINTGSTGNTFTSNILDTKWIAFSIISSNSNNFTGNTITTSTATAPMSGAPDGFVIITSLSSQIIGNTLINGNQNGGISVGTGSNFTNISNNHLFLASTTAIAVGGPTVSLAITNNTINSSSTGIVVNTLTGSTITNNQINLSGGSSGPGISLDLSSGNTVSGNVMNTADAAAIAVGAESVSHYNNIITTTNTEAGEPIYYYAYNSSGTIENLDNIGQLTLANCTNMTIRNVTLDQDGIYLLSTTGSNFYNVSSTPNGVGERALLISGIEGAFSIDNVAYNSTFNNSHPNALDITVVYGTIDLINTNFDLPKLTVADKVPGRINVLYYVNAYVNDSLGNNLEDVTVRVLNNVGTNVGETNTVANGYISSLFEVREVRLTGGNPFPVLTYNTPHTITASKTNYSTSSATINLTATENTNVYLTLTLLPNRNVSLSQPSNQSIYNSSVANYIFSVTNGGATTDNYTISVANINEAITATVNASTITNLASLQSESIGLIVADSTPGNYTVGINVTSQTNASISQIVYVTTNITQTPPAVSITLINPIANKNFIYNQNNEFTVRVSCAYGDCGLVNVSLDPEESVKITGGDPPPCNANIALDCQLQDQACIDAPNCGWVVGPANVCSANPGQGCNAIDVEGTCVVAYYCGFNSNEGGNVCYNCDWFEGSCIPNVGQICEISAPPAPETKSGLVNTTPGATPFWTAQQNPKIITLNNGETKFVTWQVNATGTPGASHTFNAYINSSTNSAITANLNITIINSSVSGTANCWDFGGNPSGCIAAGCIYDNFMGKCLLTFSNFGCNNFCGECAFESGCNTSAKNCTWDNKGFCHENFDNFQYGSSGNFDEGVGWKDVKPPNCMNNPSLCDSSFDTQFNFVKFEGICFDNVDNDQDGTVDCNDSDCYNAPECENSYNSSSDVTAPQIKNYVINENDISAMVSFTASEPVMGSVESHFENGPNVVGY